MDDGCRAEDVTMVRDLACKGTDVRVALGSARGLVHAKIFHIEWLTTGGQRAHTLVYGSSNATRQAFDGNINSELICKVRLTASSHAAVLDWIANVRNAASEPTARGREIAPLRDVLLADRVHIRLPGMRIRDAINKANSLDLWLQRGHLLSMFRPDASFLRVHINLLAELPGGDLVQNVRRIGFETPMTRRLSIPYISVADDGPNGADSIGHWRSRFFVWTQLGDWCSDACFRERSRSFRRTGYQDRIQNLKRLHTLREPVPRRDARSQFLSRVDTLWSALGDSAGAYLEARGGALNRDLYTSLYEKRVDRDLALADDAEFLDRYVSGCEMIDVPRFRTDAAAWRSFVDSFMRQVHLESLKEKSKSLIYQYTADALAELSKDDVFDSPKEIAKALRLNWNAIIEGDDGEDISFGEYVDGYHT
jgi:hypothetical protein